MKIQTCTHSSTAGKGREGFTLIELLVVITIIGILMTLMFPAINQIRETAVRLQCRNNMHQIGLGMKTYSAKYGSLPPGIPSCTTPAKLWSCGGTSTGAYCQGPNLLVGALAEIGEPQMYEYVLLALESQRNPSDDLEHEPGNIGTWTPKLLICPAAPTTTPDEMINSWAQDRGTSKGNYAGCWGRSTYLWGDPAIPNSSTDPNASGIRMQRGAFGVDMVPGWETRVGIDQRENDSGMKGRWKMGYGLGSKSSNVTDGEAKTLMLSEVVGWDDEKDARGGWVLNCLGSSVFSCKTGPNSRIEDCVSIYDEAIPEGHELHCTCPDGSGKENRKDGNTWAAARSMHPGGVNAVFCDTHAKFMNEGIDVTVWQSIATRAGGEMLGDDTFE